MRIYLTSLGCRLNYAEMAGLGRELTAAGHELAESAAGADLCVLNSCAVTGEAARQSRQLARQIARANPSVCLIVTGCYATLEQEKAAALPNVEWVVGNDRKDQIPGLIAAQAPGRHPVLDVVRTARTRAFVKVQDGCRNRCTFCVVTVARGPERSRPIAEVVAEVNGLHAEGYQEAVLTGVHVGGYGSDLGCDLRALIEALLEGTGIPRLRLSSLEPFDLAPDFFDLWPLSGGRLMPHLHLPAQSGSDAVLRRMARRNRVADFEALVEAARRQIAGLTVTTDLIAGFPGETEAHFAETIAFARRVGFAHMHVFPYSAREHTAAARFGGQVPEAERKRRVRVLSQLDAELGHGVRASFLGQVRPVLWEHRVRDARERGGDPGDLGCQMPGDGQELSLEDEMRGDAMAVWSGLTDNYLRVLAVAPATAELRNRITPTHLTRLTGDVLWGELQAL